VTRWRARLGKGDGLACSWLYDQPGTAVGSEDTKEDVLTT
jgi:hypothetical protein